MIISEHLIQTAIITWFRLRYARQYIIFAIPNGGYRDKKEAKMLKDEGVLAGVPDLFIPASRHGMHGLFIELKKPTGQVSNRQIEVIKKLQEAGYSTAICYNLEDAVGTITGYLDE